MVADMKSLVSKSIRKPEAKDISCDRSHRNYDFCTISGPTVLDPTSSIIPNCEIQHEAPAILFSAGGLTGNIFHDFNDGFIPLFITMNSIFPDQDVVLVISKARDWWVSKYTEILRTFTKYPIISLDNDTITHCFPSPIWVLYHIIWSL